MRRWAWPVAAFLWIAGGSPALGTQAEVGRYQFSVTLGLQDFDGSSALKSAAVGGVDAAYSLTPNVAVGFFGQMSRPQTDPDFFPLVRLTFGDETEFHQPAEHVTSYAVGVQARLSRPLGRITPHVLGGLGYYAFTLDPEQNRSDRSNGGLTLGLGAGATYGLGERAGVIVELRDLVFFDYDRDWFNLSDPLFTETRFPEPAPPPKESTIHNLRLTVGFSYVPGGR